MKFLAAIFSCLILMLSSGGGMSFLHFEMDGKAEVAQAECCECGGRTQDNDAAGNCDTGAEEPPHKGCPFCISHTCPGFVAVLAMSAPAMPAEFDCEKCLFIQHKYISPIADGIWQPPRSA